MWLVNSKVDVPNVTTPTYAELSLPAFAGRCYWALAMQQSMDICPSGPQQQSCSGEFAAVGRAGTDRRTPYRYIDPAPHTTGEF